MLFNRRPRVFFDTDDPAAATPAVATPPAVPDSPWAADAAAYFGDNAEALAALDRYMREKQQPYVTQLESSSAEAREYYNDLLNDTDNTLRTLISQRYGDELANAFDGLFAEEESTPPPPPPTEPTAAEVAAMSDEDRELLEWARGKRDAEQVDKQAAAYQQFKDGLKESHGLDDDDLGLIDPFIYQSPEDPDKAVAAYKAWRSKALPETAGEVDETKPPPPPLGDGATSATPPLAKQYTRYGQMGDALKDFLARDAASSTPPPVVG